VDTTGELRHLYTHATVIFVGRSLTQHGGQNIIEPALCGKPIIVGPNMENFPIVCADFLPAGALVQVDTAGDLEREIRSLLTDTSRREACGRKARELVQSRRGVVTKSVRLILDTIRRLDPEADGSQ
jgi:3-deoxy-D-manno-octulosonic-acid transferase